MVRPTSEELQRRARAVRLLVSDVDGVLTDAGVYYSDKGVELKRFSVRDGMGVELLRKVGVSTALLTRESSAIVTQRARKLAIEHVHLGVHDKRVFLSKWLQDLGVPFAEVAYIGDDLNDLGVLRLVAESGLTACPADAARALAAEAHFVTGRLGGHGAFREFADFIVEAKGQEQ
jgi:3-deoxy-D-manno-octulosonate 8-phosphate phosphatase (KDO 8-P phosphatase)